MKFIKSEAGDFFAELFYGWHHIPSGGLHKFGEGWCVNYYGDFSTFDFNYLTRFVFLCHDRCYRGSIMQSGPGMIKLVIWKRDKREGRMFERHPTLEEAFNNWREKHISEKLP
jgi:hypothetical protein